MTDQLEIAEQPTVAKNPQSSRRAVLAAGVGGVAAWLASALGRPEVVRADGEFIAVGGEYDNATSPTELINKTNGSTVFAAQSVKGGAALRGMSDSNFGVYGSSSSSAGVAGQSGSNNGVYGLALGHSGRGVFGVSVSGNGVRGESHGAAAAVYGLAQGADAAGVEGHSPSAAGVIGFSDSSIGISGYNKTATVNPAARGWAGGNATGVLGFSGPATPPNAKAKTGVYGEANQDTASRGVWGKSMAGQGIRGEASTGIGVFGAASSAAGYALRGSGRVRFDKVSGIATLAAGTTSKTISPGTDVTSESFVLLTPMADLGGRRLWFTKDVAANKITIRMSSSRTSSTSISWLLLS